MSQNHLNDCVCIGLWLYRKHYNKTEGHESFCVHDLWSSMQEQTHPIPCLSWSELNKPKTTKPLIPISPVFVSSALPFCLSVRLNLVRLTLLDVSGVKPLLKVKIWFAKRSLGHLLINICSVSGWGWWQTRPHLEIGWSGNIGWGRGVSRTGFLLSSERRKKEEGPKNHIWENRCQTRQHRRGGIRGFTPVWR